MMNITKMSCQEVPPAVGLYCLLEIPTTAAVEPVFPNKLLAKNKNFLPKNVTRNMCLHYNLRVN